MGQGWRYTLRIPSWSQVQLSDGETVVFFQVEVTVLPPDEGPPRKRSVGRRYSNFVTLYQRLREELGGRALAGLEPPPKRSFLGVNKRPDLIERRRWELEQWLWRLTEVPAIANSAMMFHFCELDAASRLIARSRAPTSPLGPPASELSGALPSYAPSWSGSEASDHHPDAGEAELAAEALGSAAAAGGRGVEPSLRTAGLAGQGADQPPDAAHRRGHAQHGQDSGHLQKSPLGSTASADSAGGLMPALSTSTSALAPVGSATSGELLSSLGGRVRLGLQVEQRAVIRGLARTLRSQLDTAFGDLQDAVREIQGDQAAIAQLAAQVQQLQDGLTAQHSARSGATAGRDALEQQAQEEELAEQQLQQERERSKGLAAELQLMRERGESLAARLAAAQGQLAAREDELRREQEAKATAQHQLEALQRQQQERQAAEEEGDGGRTELDGANIALAEAEAARQALEQQLEELGRQLEQQDAAATAVQRQLEGAGVERERLLGRAAEAEAAAAKAALERDAAVAKSRADLKVLAREVKGLRQQLASEQLRTKELAAQLAASPAAAANGAGAKGGVSAEELSGMLRDVAALRAILAECRVDVSTLPGQQQRAGALGAGAGHSKGQTQVQAPLGLLLECSRRLDGLKEQVQQELLAKAAGSELGGDGASEAGTLPPAELLRSAFGGLLLDAAEARKRYYELLRSTLAVTAHLEGLEQRVGTPISSPTRALGDAHSPPPPQLLGTSGARATQLLAGTRSGSPAQLMPAGAEVPQPQAPVEAPAGESAAPEPAGTAGA